MSDLMTRIDRLLTEESAEYKAFFNKKLKEWGVDSIDDLSDEDKKKFFAEVEKEWTKDKDHGE